MAYKFKTFLLAILIAVTGNAFAQTNRVWSKRFFSMKECAEDVVKYNYPFIAWPTYDLYYHVYENYFDCESNPFSSCKGKVFCYLRTLLVKDSAHSYEEAYYEEKKRLDYAKEHFEYCLENNFIFYFGDEKNFFLCKLPLIYMYRTDKPAEEDVNFFKSFYSGGGAS